MTGKLHAYYQATKPRVTYVNALTALAGYLYAVGLFGGFQLGSFIALAVGVTLIIASACVLNNLLDRDIDSRMKRTETRPTVTGAVTTRGALVLTITLGLVGALVLYFYNGLAVLLLGALGYIAYVLFYGMLAKRLSLHGTLVGSLSGAIPIVAGYVAVSGRVDLDAIILFLILFLWQEPAFYAIAIFRRDEYRAAGVPVISVVRGNRNAAQQIVVYLLFYLLAVLSLSLFGRANWLYFAIMLVVGGYWLYLAAAGFREKNLERWAHKIFRVGLVNMIVLCVVLPFGSLL